MASPNISQIPGPPTQILLITNLSINQFVKKLLLIVTNK